MKKKKKFLIIISDPNKYLIDIIQYHNHCDPHIRGCVYLLIGSLINSALLESMEHSNLFNEQDSKFSLEFLTNIILKVSFY